MVDEKKEFNDRVTTLRELLGLSDLQFAKKLEKPSSSKFGMKKCDLKPGYPFLKRIVEVYNVNPYFLIFGEEPIMADRTDSVRINGCKPGKRIDTLNDLLWYMGRSDIFNYSILAFAQKFLSENQSTIDMEIEEREERMQKESK